MFSSGTRGGHPALPVPENPKAKHLTSDKFLFKAGSWGSHSVFGGPATQVPENPKIEHPTPKVTSAVLTQFWLTDHETSARRRLPPKFSQSSEPKDTHFVSGEVFSNYQQLCHVRVVEMDVSRVYRQCGRPSTSKQKYGQYD